jgi:hypothetical protein
MGPKRTPQSSRKRQPSPPPDPTPETTKRVHHRQSSSFYDIAIVKLSEIASPRGTHEYSPLDDQRAQIRLLHLMPGKDDDPIVCTLKHMSIDGPQEYDALSYCWGPNDAKKVVKILEYHKAPDRRPSFKDIHLSTFYVRPTLYGALRNLRDQKQIRILWVDAICINQDDVSERNHQVSKMAEIYNMASHVSIWLGDGTPESDMAMSFINQVLDPSRFDLLLGDDATVSQWAALLSLMRRPWFSRRWIIQEIMLARKATLHCGKLSQDWSNFAGIVEVIGGHVKQLKQLFARSSEYGKDTEILSDLQTFGAYRLAQAASTLLRKSDDGRVLERRCSLEELLLTLPNFECGNLRDTVYSVLSLARDIPSSLSRTEPFFEGKSMMRANIAISPTGEEFPVMMTVNYDNTIAQVFADVIDFYISSTGRLDILCRHWAPSKNIVDPLPSWILPLSTTSKYLGPRYRNQGLKISNSLVGQPNQRNYNACGHMPAAVTFGSSTVQRVHERWQLSSAGKQYFSRKSVEEVQAFNGLMFVRGFRLNYIGKLGPRGAEGMIPYEWLDMIDINETGIQEAFWRTLVANRSEDQRAPPAWFRQSWQHCMNSSPHGDINITELIHANASSMVSSFLIRVQNVIWNRKFFITNDGLRLGLAPLGAREKDVVCIFYGCSVPVILREHTDSTGHYFQFIGECYVHGMMDGEALSQATPMQERTEEFKLK